jgi:hypothetical protein
MALLGTLLGRGEFADPWAARLDCDGVGQPETALVVEGCCGWLEMAEDLR